jgi:hypothetical protein
MRLAGLPALETALAAIGSKPPADRRRKQQRRHGF